LGAKKLKAISIKDANRLNVIRDKKAILKFFIIVVFLVNK
jgi:hypothetical protein